MRWPLRASPSPQRVVLLLCLAAAALLLLGAPRSHAWTPGRPPLWHEVSSLAAAAFLSSHARAPSPPLVTGDALRAHADHVCDETACELAPALRSRGQAAGRVLREGETVFVKVDALPFYLDLLRQAGAGAPPHIILSHNGDLPVDAAAAAELQRLGPRVVCALFAQNVALDVPASARIHAVPIGLENRPYSNGRCPALYSGMPTLAGGRALAAAGEELLRALVALGALPASEACTGGDGSMTAARAAALLAPARKLIYAAFSLATNPVERSRAASGLADLAAASFAVGDAPADVAARAAGTAAAAAAALDDAAARAFAARIAAWHVGSAAPPPACPPRAPQAGAAAWAAAALRACGAAAEHVHRAAAFFSGMDAHPFVASPPGNGLQSHRTWEALMAGRVPVVLRTGGPMDELYAGLPVVLVDGWADAERPAAGAGAALLSQEMLLGVLLRLATAARNSEARGRDARASPLDARLLARAPALLSAEERAHLAAATLQMERVFASHWLGLVDAERLRCRDAAASAEAAAAVDAHSGG